MPQIQIGGFFESCTAPARSATVDAHDNEALLCQVGIVEAAVAHRTGRPRIDDLLAARTAILKQNDRIFLAGIEVGGLHHPAVQFHLLRRGERERFALGQLIGRELLAQRRIVLEGRKQIAVAVAHGEDVGRVIIAPRVDEILEIAREDGRVPPFGLCEPRCLSVFVAHENLPVVGA